MLGKTPALAAGAALLMLAGAAEAKTCRDAKGHFAACPSAAARASAAPGAAVNASARTRCRDAQGHFASCQAAAAPTPAPAARPSALSRILRGPAAPTGTAANTAATAPAAPAGAGAPTARCRDGSLSYSKHRSGTCAGHKGVASWS